VKYTGGGNITGNAHLTCNGMGGGGGSSVVNVGDNSFVDYAMPVPKLFQQSVAGFHYGRRSPDYSKPRLWLEDYKTAAIPNPVYGTVVDRATGIVFPMYLNNSIGDCTIAGLGHVEGAWTKILKGSASELIFANQTIQNVYSAISGYIPGQPSTDTGCEISDVLAYWMNTGIPDTSGKNHILSSYAQIATPDQATLNWALKNFGTVYLGINCPESAETQFSQGLPWTYVQGSPIAGGHCITLQSNPSSGNYGVTTWGTLQMADQGFLDHYLEEAWVPIGADWLNAADKTVTGLNVSQLMADSQVLAA
jgi:hypothetical protein